MVAFIKNKMDNLKLGQQYDLQTNQGSFKVVYQGEAGGWYTFQSIVGKYQVWQYSPETITGVTLSANTEVLAPKEEPKAELIPFTPEVLPNPVVPVTSQPVLQPKAK